MYIYISEEILKDTSLSGDEKIVLSFIKLLTSKGKNFFGGEQWLADNFGMQNAASSILSLKKKDRIIETTFGLRFNKEPRKISPDNYDIKVKNLDDLQSELIGWKNRGYEVTRESEDSVFLSNGQNSAIVRKFK